ncbi:DUF1302 domain-containing protein [Oceanobacter mangrovi]|uniref:DUF1302 domain-containing protein n=1 Tax=Oceanobacter mangrovi TaxID=2862510 RepID=UPI001C8EDBD4|nr:DUF1302 domain-containing protein [Oceanobacter mangrovi]
MSNRQTTPATRTAACGRPALLAVAIAAAISAGQAQAFMVTNSSDMRIMWDTTAKYSAMYRLTDQHDQLVADTQGNWPNTDDGNRNFDKGLVSSRVDVLTELDVIYKRNYGLRLSGAAWYDSQYQDSNDNDSPTTSNTLSTDYNEFTQGTKDLHGQSAEMLDYFAFGRVRLGDMSLTGRIGSHTMVWGESLFFGGNGIANGQAPIDVAKAMAVPSVQFKELMRPVEQISGQLQISRDVSVGAYYQLDFKKTRLPGSGSYFSSVDFLSEGAEQMLLAADGSAYFKRVADKEASDNGQFGFQLRFRTDDADYGLYAIRYHSKAPNINVRPNGSPYADDDGRTRVGDYRWLYHEGIKAFGASATRTIGNFNFAGEVSFRYNTPLNSDAAVDLSVASGGAVAPGGNTAGTALYAVGKTAHAQINWLASIGPNFLSREADFLGEIAYNHVREVTSDRGYTSENLDSGGPQGVLNPNGDRDAWNMRLVYSPKYRQVLSGLDLSVPVVLGYGLHGNSLAEGSFMGEKTGDLSLGVEGTYLDVWRFGVNYTNFFGPVDNTIDENGHGSYKQAMADRDNISFNIRRTF